MYTHCLLSMSRQLMHFGVEHAQMLQDTDTMEALLYGRTKSLPAAPGYRYHLSRLPSAESVNGATVNQGDVGACGRGSSGDSAAAAATAVRVGSPSASLARSPVSPTQTPQILAAAAAAVVERRLSPSLSSASPKQRPAAAVHPLATNSASPVAPLNSSHTPHVFINPAAKGGSPLSPFSPPSRPSALPINLSQSSPQQHPHSPPSGVY